MRYDKAGAANRITMLKRLFACGLACGVLWAVPVAAQDSGTANADHGPPDPAAATAPAGPINLMITSQRRPPRCGTTNGRGEIVVCGADNGADVRVPSTSDSDPDSREGQDTGIPQAPSVSGLPDCRRGCIGMGKAPPPVYVIDLKSIPEAPKGSDAEKVARGEISDR